MSKQFVVFRIYRVPAETKGQAWAAFRDAEAAGNLNELLERESIKEDIKPAGILGELKRQVMGK